MKRETCKKHTRILSLLLALALLCSLAPPAVYAAEPAYELVESWTGADLTDTAKYATANCTVAIGTDETIGGYVAITPTNFGPALTVAYTFDATKYTEPTVGFWMKQGNDLVGSVKLLSGETEVGTTQLNPVAGEWMFVTVSLTGSADAIQFAPNPYGSSPSIGSVYFGSKADVEKIAEKPYEVVEAWTGADLTDTSKYATTNCTIAAGTDETIGGYVVVTPTNFGPTLTVAYTFDATKYTEPTVGFWMKQGNDLVGSVKLLSGGTEVGTAQLNPVAGEWMFVTVALTGSADAIQFAPNPYGSSPSVGSVYFGGKADVEKIPDEFDFSKPEPTEPEPTDPDPTDPTEPAVPGGQGRWVLLDNFEGGKISKKKYSVNDSYQAVASDRFGNYSAYNDGTGGYLKYDQDVPASDYENPAIGFWAKGTEGAALMFWGNNPLGTVTLHEEWTYYVWTGGLKSQIKNYGTGDLDYINMWSAQGTEVWLDQIYFGEKEDLEVAPDLAEGYDYYQLLPGDEPGPEYESSDKVIIYSSYDFEDAAIPEGAETATVQGGIQWEIYDLDRMFTEYYDMLTTTWDDYSLMIREDSTADTYAAGQKNKGILTMPSFEVTEEMEINQLAVTFKYMTKYNRDTSVNWWQILPEQHQNLTLEVSATGESWTEIWNLNEEMGDDLYNGSWYMVSAPVDAKFLSQGKLYYRFVYESNGGNALALDDILVEEYIAPMKNEEIEITAYKIHDIGANAGLRGFLSFNTADPKTVVNSDGPGTYEGQRYSAMDYYNGVIYAVVQYSNTLVALDPYTFEVQDRALLLEYKKRRFSKEEAKNHTAAKKKKQFNGATAAELKKLWKPAALSDGSLEVGGYYGTDTYVVVPTMIGKKQVTRIGSCCFYVSPFNGNNRKDITFIDIPEGVSGIGDRAFVGCKALLEIHIPKTVSAIGEYAFWECSCVSIHAPAGSYAETYAKENNIPFVAE